MNVVVGMEVKVVVGVSVFSADGEHGTTVLPSCKWKQTSIKI